MKHFLSVIVASIIAFVMMFSTATAEQTDFLAYEIREKTPYSYRILVNKIGFLKTNNTQIKQICLNICLLNKK